MFKDVISASISFIDGSRLRIVLGSRVVVRSTAGRQRELDRHNIHLQPPLICVFKSSKEDSLWSLGP